MNYILKIPAALIGIILVFLLTACTKNVPGPHGEPGTPGKNGNLKMTTVSFAAKSWSLGEVGWDAGFNTPLISNNVITNGEVEVYMKIENKWWTLPYGAGDYFMQASYEKNWVRLTYFKIHGEPPTKPDSINFRIVILEPLQ